MQSKVQSKKTGREVGEIPAFGEMKEWFKSNLPQDENSIVHGDYKIDNIVSSTVSHDPIPFLNRF